MKMNKTFNIEALNLENQKNTILRNIEISAKVNAGNIYFTRLIRLEENEQSNSLCAPPAQLAFWLIDNWWRLRWESPPGTFKPEWRLAHDLSSIGGGYFWPQVSLWGEEDRIGIAASSSDRTEALQFLTSGLFYVAADDMEGSIEEFIESLIEDKISDYQTLQEEYKILLEERKEADIADWRKLEAKLGFDPDEAPETLMEELADLIGQYGKENIEEAAIAHQGSDSAMVLQKEIKATLASSIRMKIPEAVKEVPVSPSQNTIPPWELAEEAAMNLREKLSIPSGSIKNESLSDILGVSKHTFNYNQKREPSPFKYALRVKAENSEENLIKLTKRRQKSRRFELCRMLGDVIWSDNAVLGPVSAAKTARQKFQRTFAQSFLCPFSDLQGYIETDHPTDEDISAASDHFQVSELMVQSVLVDKGLIERSRLELLPDRG